MIKSTATDRIAKQPNAVTSIETLSPVAVTFDGVRQSIATLGKRTHGEMERQQSNAESVSMQDFGSKSFVCQHNSCGKAFKVRKKLVSHMHLHLGTQPFRCGYPGCGKAFSEKANLDIHNRIHLDIRPFSCPLGCGKSFRTKGNMQEHERRHYSDR